MFSASLGSEFSPKLDFYWGSHYRCSAWPTECTTDWLMDASCITRGNLLDILSASRVLTASGVRYCLSSMDTS